MSANIWKDIKTRYNQGNAVIKLIMVNIAVHVLVLLVSVFLFLITGDDASYWAFIFEWLYFPSELGKIPFRPWTIFTYMFLHAHNDIFHILMNMLILYWFGQKLNDLLPNSKIFPIYILGGVVGALVFAIGFNTFPPFADSEGNLVGASASVMAIVLAAATLNPKGTIRLFIIGEVELQYVALVWIIYNLIVIPGGNPGGALAHLGGAFMGWFFIQQLRKGKDLALPVNRALDRVTRKKVLKKHTIKHKPGKPKPQEAKTASSFTAKMKIYKGSQKTDYYGNEYGRSFMQKYKDMSREECLNTILDKIKRSGYDGLTEDEKVFLDRYQ
jgi:membrane associated rhomboid family serine protease